MITKQSQFFLLALILTLLSYLSVLNNEFLGDDYIRILHNPELLNIWSSLTGDLGDRPVLMSLIWAEFKFFGTNPTGYRIIGIILHAFVALKLYQIIEKESKQHSYAPLMIGLLFALHPLNSQTLNIVIQQGVILASLFALLSLSAFFDTQESGSKKHLGFSIFYFVLSMLCKPIASFLPLFLLVATLYPSRASKFSRSWILLYLPALLLPVLFYALGEKNTQNLKINSLDYFFIQSEVVFTYFKLILIPINFQYLYDFFPAQNFNWPFLLGHLAIFGLVLKFVSNKLFKLFFIGFYLSFLPESGFFPINHLAFEHRTYLPLAFLAMGLGMWPQTKKVMMILLIVLGIYLGLNQLRNSEIYPRSRWVLDTVTKSYTDHGFNFTATTYLIKEGQLKEAAPVIDIYRKNYPEVAIYQILIDSYDYKVDPSRKDLLAKVAENLKKDFPYPEVRRWGNSLLIKEWSDPIKLEGILALQMPIFLSSFKDYGPYVDYYQVIAQDLLKDEVKLNQIDPKLKGYIKDTLNQIQKGHP